MRGTKGHFPGACETSRLRHSLRARSEKSTALYASERYEQVEIVTLEGKHAYGSH